MIEVIDLSNETDEEEEVVVIAPPTKKGEAVCKTASHP